MQDTSADDKNPSASTAKVQRTKQIAALVREMRMTGCQVIDILGEAEADPSATVTAPEREARQLIGQLGNVLGRLIAAQEAADTAPIPDGTDGGPTDDGSLADLFGEVDASDEGPELRGFE
jgi:hypothetical protein